MRSVLSATYGRRFDNYLAKILTGDSIAAELNVLLLNDQVALVGMPGEVFVEFQLDLKSRSPLADTLLVGYTNGYHAYFPDNPRRRGRRLWRQDGHLCRPRFGRVANERSTRLDLQAARPAARCAARRGFSVAGMGRDQSG